MRSSGAVLVLVLLLGGCRCQQPRVTTPGPGDLLVRPDRLDFADVFVGQRVALELELSNLGESRLELSVETVTPFDVGSSTVSLGRGESMRLDVGFRPVTPGPVEGVLRVGGQEVLLVGLGRAVPVCGARVCERATFDLSTKACVAVAEPVGAPCVSRCVTTGQCRAVGQCEGMTISCDDGDVCTVDACVEESGQCASTPRQCATPANPCQRAVCRSQVGCVTEDVDDGELCGVDDCRSTMVDVCVSGRCSSRSRPANGRCSNRWVAATMPDKSGAVLGFDPVNRRHVLFGGSGGADTWSWDGARWTQLFPADAPAPGSWEGVFDARRGRLLLAGASSAFETWEWSGQTWLQRRPARSPPVSRNLALAYDERRGRVVLFGGFRFVFPHFGDETWEWDGVTWSRASPALAPPPRDSATLFFDGQRVILFGGWNGQSALDDVWAWDGQAWESLEPSARPPATARATAVYDPVRRRTLLVGGFDSLGVRQTRSWEWDGATFAEVSGPGLGGRIAGSWDPVRAQAVLLDGKSGATWEGRAGALSLVAPAPLRPAERVQAGWAFDPVAGNSLLFGGVGGGSSGSQHPDTWAWDGQRWSLLADAGPMAPLTAIDPLSGRPLALGVLDAGVALFRWDGRTWTQIDAGTAPSARVDAALTTDARRQRVVLFGGAGAPGQSFADTWEFDGRAWAPVIVDGGPSARSGHAMAYDPVAREVVLFGGVHPESPPNRTFDDTWRFDGREWHHIDSPVRPPGRRQAALAFDPTLGGVVLTGGWRVEPDGTVSSFNQTWLLQGSTWRDLGAEASWREWSPQLVFDAPRSRLTLLSGTSVWWFVP